jgi:hypothetical protein
MYRKGDESGVSGIGHILDGIQFDNGKVVVTWYGKGKVQASSVAVYDSFEDFEKIHITSHPTNDTEIIWKEV